MSTAIIGFASTDTGLTIADFTWDFCKRINGVDIPTIGSYLTELGVGVYELTNPNVTTKATFSIYPTADDTKRVTGELAGVSVDASALYKAIIGFAPTDTGMTISNFTWDFCKRLNGVDVSTNGSYLTEFGVGVYELTNPNILDRTTFSIYPTSDDTKRVTGEFGSTATGVSVYSAGYTTYLQMINKVLKRITQPELLVSVSEATGTAKIIAELINEAQIELWMEATNWYTLYAMRSFYTATSINAYPHTSDFGRTIDLVDVTSNRVLVEDTMRIFDEDDPDNSNTGTPTHFSLEGKNYRIYPTPQSELIIRERYWKIPGVLTADGATTDLPLFCENFIINWALMSILEYLNKFEQADRLRVKLYGTQINKADSILYKCKMANKKIIDQMLRFDSTETRMGLQPPRFPSHYGVH